ncbi:unnamed protein product, partial [Rotaria socialis]
MISDISHISLKEQLLLNVFIYSYKPQPLDYLINQNKWITLSICLILIIIYYWLFSIFFPMMKDAHYKHEYFDEHLKKERDQLNTIKHKLIQLKEEARNNLHINDLVCHKFWHTIYDLDYNYICLLIYRKI